MYKFIVLKVLFLLMILLSPIVTWAIGDVVYSGQQISRSNGLINEKVTAIERDSDGTYWVGTTMGLSRIVEGRVVQLCGAEQFTNREISHIFKDLTGRMWVISQEKLYYYDAYLGEFLPAQYDGRDIYTTSYAFQRDGIIFGNIDSLFRYTYSNNEFQQIDLGLSAEFNIRYIARVSDNQIAIMDNEQRIYVYDIVAESIEELSGINLEGYTIIRSIFVDSQNRLWVPLYGRGILCFSIKGDGHLLHHIDAPKIDDDINIILDIVERNGKLWVTTDGGGVHIIDLEDYSIEPFEERIDQKIAAQIKSSMTVLVDNEDEIWIGTIRNGVVNIKKTYLKGFNSRDYHQWWDGLASATIICMDEDRQGNIWLGVDDGGIACYNPTTMSLRYIRSTAGLKVTDVENIDDSDILISVYNRGVFRVNKISGEISHVTVVNKTLDDKVRDYSMLISFERIDSNRVLIIADQAYIYDIATKRIGPSNSPDLNALSGFKFSQNYKNEILLYSHNQIYVLNPITLGVKMLYSVVGEGIITDVCKKGDDIWMVQDNELKVYELKSGQLTTVKNPLQDKIQTVFLDFKGNVWVTSYSKLLCIKNYVSHSNTQCLIFDIADGYMPNEYNPRSMLIADNGDMYIGGNDGFMSIDSDITYKDFKSYDISLISIELDGEPLRFSKDSIETLVFDVPWHYSGLQCAVCVNNSNMLRKNSYRYLISSNAKQSIIYSDNNLSLSTLSSGHYRIDASYMMSNGEWSNDITIMEINVSTPWWRSKMWYLTITLLIVAIVIWLLNLYYRYKKQNLVRLHNERKSELERDKVKFLINVSHELRTPLTLIHAPLRRIIDRENLEEGLRSELSKIFVQSRQMGKLINMVLNLRKMESGYDELNIKSHRLNDWVRQIAEEFRVELSVKGIEIQYELSDVVTTLNFDADKCKSVLSNLLMNAYKYSDENTNITLRTELNEGSVCVSVIDQGVGLQGVDIDKLFDRFVQQHDKSRGTGIGLSYSKVLIELHSGKIGAYANPLRGSTFYYQIPLNLECAKSSCESNEYLNIIMNDRSGNSSIKSLDYPLSEHTVLVVEDKKELREFVRNSLKEYFKRVYVAVDGVEALSMVRSHFPDIVLSDVMMPNMDGFELCATMKNDINISHIPVILVTSKVESTNRIMGYKLGADSYVSKPFEIEEVVDIIRNQLYSRSMIRRRYADIAITPTEQVTTFSNADEQFFIKLNNFIKDNISNPELNVTMLTQHMCMSRATFYKKLSAVIDVGAMEYVAKLRIALAAELLLSTDDSISTVASAVGYNDNQYFSRIFKSYYNCTPTYYRKQSGKID